MGGGAHQSLGRDVGRQREISRVELLFLIVIVGAALLERSFVAAEQIEWRTDGRAHGVISEWRNDEVERSKQRLAVFLPPRRGAQRHRWKQGGARRVDFRLSLRHPCP